MPPNLHLFSTPGQNDISDIVEACRPYLENKDDPVIAYVPLASLYAEKLTDEQITRPDSGGWSPKDNLAHLAEWMNLLMGYHMEKRPAHQVMGVAQEVTKGWDMEVINPVLFERNKNRPRGEVLDGLKQVYGRLEAKLDAMTFEEMMKPRHADGPEKRPLLLWILGDSSEHFLEHRETIERAIREN